MKNYEKYADEIKGYKGSSFCRDIVVPYILKSEDCGDITCDRCHMLQRLWLLEEYEEPETDWSKVVVDTPILVRQGKTGHWLERHFAKYENGNVYAWVDGQTSWTGADKIKWKYAKLAEGEKECEEPKVDWSEVNVDTPILVRDYEDTESATVVWLKRYFAEYKDGLVYAWTNGRTSWNEDKMYGWKYAKLAESEE